VVCGNARVSRIALVCGSAWVDGDAVIRNTRDLLCVGPVGSRDGHTTFFRTEGGVGVRCGCFLGTLGKFRARVEEVHGGDRHGAEYRLAIALAEARMGTREEGGTGERRDKVESRHPET
jgi:hypothetical protein